MNLLKRGDRGSCITCGWPNTRIIQVLNATSGICWWCTEEGWKLVPPVKGLPTGRRGMETVAL